jgi:hypothetical protein
VCVGTGPGEPENRRQHRHGHEGPADVWRPQQCLPEPGAPRRGNPEHDGGRERAAAEQPAGRADGGAPAHASTHPADADEERERHDTQCDEDVREDAVGRRGTGPVAAHDRGDVEGRGGERRIQRRTVHIGQYDDTGTRGRFHDDVAEVAGGGSGMPHQPVAGLAPAVAVPAAARVDPPGMGLRDALR